MITANLFNMNTEFSTSFMLWPSLGFSHQILEDDEGTYSNYSLVLGLFNYSLVITLEV